jgi:hypothetical protein
VAVADPEFFFSVGTKFVWGQQCCEFIFFMIFLQNSQGFQKFEWGLCPHSALLGSATDWWDNIRRGKWPPRENVVLRNLFNFTYLRHYLHNMATYLLMPMNRAILKICNSLIP